MPTLPGGFQGGPALEPAVKRLEGTSGTPEAWRLAPEGSCPSHVSNHMMGSSKGQQGWSWMTKVTGEPACMYLVYLNEMLRSLDYLPSSLLVWLEEPS